MKKIYKYFGITIAVLLLDQLSKYITRISFDYAQSLNVIGDFFRLTWVQNKNAAFSLGFASPSFNRLFFSIFSAIASGFISYLIIKEKRKVLKGSYALILGGALGNLTDRLFLGSVTDFLDFDFPNFIMERWPVFNIADIAIFCGLAMCVIYELMLYWQKRRNNEKN